MQFQTDLHFKYVSELTNYILTKCVPHRRCLFVGRSLKLVAVSGILRELYSALPTSRMLQYLPTTNHTDASSLYLQYAWLGLCGYSSTLRRILMVFAVYLNTLQTEFNYLYILHYFCTAKTFYRFDFMIV